MAVTLLSWLHTVVVCVDQALKGPVQHLETLEAGLMLEDGIGAVVILASRNPTRIVVRM